MPATPRKSTQVSTVSRVSQVQTHQMLAGASPFASASSPAKRKRGQKTPSETPNSSASRAFRRARITTTTATAVASDGTEVIDLTGPTPSPLSTPKKRKQPSSDSPAAQKEEKRLRVFRKWAPQTYLLKLERARTQRLFVLNRKGSGTEEVPEQVVDIVGSTGNVYQVVVGKIPTCTCPDSRKHNQCKHIVYVLHNVLKAPDHLQYQLAFLSSELREIFQKVPPNPTDSASKSDTEGKRKEISGDCPICFMEFEPANEEIEWCKAACGNNIHKTCFQQWVSSQRGKQACCVYCRTPWQREKPNNDDLLAQGYVNEEGYLNVGGTMGLSGERDYSTYHRPPWSRRRSYYPF